MYIYHAVYPTHPIATTISINYTTIDWLDILFTMACSVGLHHYLVLLISSIIVSPID